MMGIVAAVRRFFAYLEALDGRSMTAEEKARFFRDLLALDGKGEFGTHELYHGSKIHSQKTRPAVEDLCDIDGISRRKDDRGLFRLRLTDAGRAYAYAKSKIGTEKF